jgi:hypothetical protein
MRRCRIMYFTTVHKAMSMPSFNIFVAADGAQKRGSQLIGSNNLGQSRVTD